MKKKSKIILLMSLCIFIVLSIGGLFFAGNYLYELALNPATDKSMIFNNKATKNADTQVVIEERDIFTSSSYADRYISSNDNTKLHAYEFNNHSDKWVVIVHGYTSQGNTMNASVSHFYNQGYNVLVPDLKGHGLSEGDYIGMGWDDRLDVMKWIDLINKENSDNKIILYGVSMGAATILNVSGEAKLADNVILAIEDCGYTNTWDIFEYQLNKLFQLPSHPFLDFANYVTQMRAGYSFNEGGPISQVSKAKIPILFIHGDKDAFVPSYMLDELYEAANGVKEKLIIKGAGHAESVTKDAKTYWSSIDRFILKYGK